MGFEARSWLSTRLCLFSLKSELPTTPVTCCIAHGAFFPPLAGKQRTCKTTEKARGFLWVTGNNTVSISSPHRRHRRMPSLTGVAKRCNTHSRGVTPAPFPTFAFPPASAQRKLVLSWQEPEGTSPAATNAAAGSACLTPPAPSPASGTGEARVPSPPPPHLARLPRPKHRGCPHRGCPGAAAARPGGPHVRGKGPP